MSLIDYDKKLALEIYNQGNCLGITENAVFPENKNGYRPRTLVDDTLEYIDPTPNIHTLFVQFNEKFFWNKLLPVQVKWSPRMTSCAGTCTFHPRNKECIITLSNPLLKLRPRKDLVETLLHEMIHAYLFLINDNRDRDGHGPVFCEHMGRINKEAGTNITIYHSFHAEVKLYQQHWWKCNGPCKTKPPYFGMVKRSMNRPPGKNDFWFATHQATCGGQFIKIHEPEKPQKHIKSKESSKTEKTSKNKNVNNKTPMDKWLNNNKTGKGGNQINNSQSDLKKLGNSTNNVHGWGTGGPGSSQGTITSSTPKKTPSISFSGTLGGQGIGRSNLIDKYYNNNTNILSASNSGALGQGTKSNLIDKYYNNNKNIPSVSNSGASGGQDTGKSNLIDKYYNNNKNVPSTSNFDAKNKNKNFNVINDTKSKVPCPMCKILIDYNEINKHLDNVCLNNSNENVIDLTDKEIPSENSNNLKTLKENVNCPLCDLVVSCDKINDHLDNICLIKNQDILNASSSHTKRKSDTQLSDKTKLLKTDNETTVSDVNCPVCTKRIKFNLFDDHFEKCLDKNKKLELDGSYKADNNSDVLLVSDFNSSAVNLSDSPNQCLICNKVIEDGKTLEEHLEECLGAVFNDDSKDNEIDASSDNEESSKTKDSENSFTKYYPCPVCEAFVEVSLMNEHIEGCLHNL